MPSADASARSVQVLPERGELMSRTLPAPSALSVLSATSVGGRPAALPRYGIGQERDPRELLTIARTPSTMSTNPTIGTPSPPDPVPGVLIPWTPLFGVGVAVAPPTPPVGVAVGVGVGVGVAEVHVSVRLPT